MIQDRIGQCTINIVTCTDKIRFNRWSVFTVRHRLEGSHAGRRAFAPWTYEGSLTPQSNVGYSHAPRTCAI